MRGGPANSNGDATAPHGVGGEEGKSWAACRQAEGSRRIADASGSSSCGEALAQPHPPSASVRAGPAGAQHAQAQVAARDGGPHSRDELDLPWLLMPDTALAEHTVDNPSGRPDTQPVG